MFRRLPLRGTLLNSAAVLAGGLLGLALAGRLPPNLLETALAGLGLATIAMAVRMTLGAPSVLAAAGAVAFGGMIGAALGISPALDAAAEAARVALGGTGRFQEALVTTSLLFCVGPMTLLGCIQDGVEHRIDILALKSLLDGVASVVFAATLGPGVLVSAAVVLVFQGALTLLARPLAPVARDATFLDDTTAAGGMLLLGIGIGLAGIHRFPMADFLPALVLAPLFTLAGRRWAARRAAEGRSPA